MSFDRQKKAKISDCGYDFLDDETSIIDHTLFQYITPHEHLNCSICQLPFFDPYTTCCGHSFCHTCLEESLKMTGMKCPLDRTALNPSNINEVFPAPIVIKNLIDELVIKCLNDGRGCCWNGPRWEIKKHLTEGCEFTRFQCNFKDDCRKWTERRYLDGSDKCVHQLITCGCGTEMMKYEQLEHQQNQCSSNQTQCNGCNLLFTKKEMEEHELCCEKQYLKCEASKFGCDWKGPRLLFETIHGRNCQFVKLSAYLNEQDNKLQKLNDTNRSLQSQMSMILDAVMQGKISNLGFGLMYDEVTSSSMMRLHAQPSQGEDEKLQLFMELEKLKLDIAKLENSTHDTNRNLLSNLLSENSRIKEELSFQKNTINSLRQQLHFLLVERRRSSGNLIGYSSYSSDDENGSSSSINGIKL